MQVLENIWGTMVIFFKEFFIDAVSEITVVDVFDILILSFILFSLYRFLRDRRAGKLMVGLFLIVVLLFIVSALEMKAMVYLFGKFYQLGLIAILLVFQPEMRAALEKVGGTPFSGFRGVNPESRELASLNSTIEAICTAVSDLSREKVGALIVIERTTRLGEYIKSGVIVDAALSPFLIRNIFFDKAPLHDGAVIIRDKRLFAAGCFLPLSTKYDIDKNLGTRHRAAIGMTEVSDAIVIVVSEETGNISMSIGGNLTRNYSYRSLKQELNNILNPQRLDENGKKHRRKKEKKEGADL